MLLLTDRIRQPELLVVADGVGVDSTAKLIRLLQLGLRPDKIIFADTGAEKPETYAYIAVREQWLAAVGFPALTIVRNQVTNFKHWPPYRSLDENCFTNGTLPSLAFGRKSCSQKWKVRPQDEHLESWEPALTVWDAGRRVKKTIGYDAGPQDSKRYAHAEGFDDPRFEYWYPLREAGWDRAECIRQINRVGLPVPVKSACFMCPATKPAEMSGLSRKHLRAIVVMEARAHPRLLAYAERKGWPRGEGVPIVEGLWRRRVKGMRGATPKPGQMTEYIREHALLPAAEIEWLSVRAHFDGLVSSLRFSRVMEAAA